MDTLDNMSTKFSAAKLRIAGADAERKNALAHLFRNHVHGIIKENEKICIGCCSIDFSSETISHN